MRKIYSLVLLAAALLVGTNAWADVLHATQQSGDEAKVKINDGAWQYATHLKDAFDAVEMDQTAEIVLLDNVTLTRQSGNENYGITLPSTIEKADLSGANAKAGPNIKLDMNGKQIETGTGLLNDSITIFRIVKGSLNITGTGKIYKPGSVAGGENSWSGNSTITIGGTNDKTAANWSSLTIGENVTVEMKAPYYSWLANNKVNWWKAKAIAVAPFAVGSMKNKNDLLYTTQGDPGAQDSKFGYHTRSEKGSNSVYYNKLSSEEQSCMGTMSTWGAAYGVNVTIAGTVIGPLYGLHVHGNINSRPTCAGDNANFPHILVTSTAHIQAADTCGTTGIYSAGYSIMEIHGEVTGATGIYMKSGDITLTDAVVESTYEGNTINYGGNSGLNGAGGSGIAIESSENYAGDMGISVQGDTKVTGGGGYAIYDQVTAPDGGSTTSHITIEGGTIEGGSEGAIAIASGTVDVTSIAGGNIDGTQVQVTDYSDPESPTKSTVVISNFIPEGTHTTTVQDGDKTIVVVSAGAAPTEYDHVYGNAKDSVKWVGTGADATETLADNLTLKELEINQSYNQTLIIGDPENANPAKQKVTLTVGRVVLGENAQIIVNPGSKLIVTGDQGIVAPKTSNIVLKANADTHAQFLFNPNVTSNRHPHATVEFTSASYRVDANDRYNQPFGVPTSTELTSITADRSNRVAFFRYNYGIGDWENIGYINRDNPSTQTELNYSDLNNPFAYYQILCTSSTPGTVITMEGDLVGNDNQNMSYLEHAYMGFANSYTADIDLASILPTIPGANEAIYIHMKEDEQYLWRASSTALMRTTKIAPMQAFVILNRGMASSSELNYRNMVWTPVMGSAPARTTTYSTLFDIKVSSLKGVDYVSLIEDSRFTSEFDQGEAEKYMNPNVNIYVSDANPMAIFATDDINNTYVGFSCKYAGTYTLKFKDVEAENLILVDLFTNAQILISEGQEYQFDATANEENDYRFQIRRVANVVTDVETVEQVEENNSGIYTITGQYVGNMSIWNTLPSGLYIVDGVKKVK